MNRSDETEYQTCVFDSRLGFKKQIEVNSKKIRMFEMMDNRRIAWFEAATSYEEWFLNARLGKQLPVECFGQSHSVRPRFRIKGIIIAGVVVMIDHLMDMILLKTINIKCFDHLNLFGEQLAEFG
jgi:hypothetical protein